MPKTSNAISISVSEQVVKFKPGGLPTCFEVTIGNQSQQFASFHLELEAHGASPNSGSDWYTLSPEVSTKKPPGDRTQFRVAITDTPVPGFVGTMNLTVRVFSLELRQEERQILRLILEPGKGSIPLKLDLPARTFQVQPRDLLEIPIHLYNPGQLPAEVTLGFLGLEPGWLIEGTERHLRVTPGGRAETNFLCQIPVAAQALSRTYPFTITATQSNGPPAQAEGAIEIVPTGFVEFMCAPTQQTLPEGSGWLPNWTGDRATYQLLFENQSNLTQQVAVEVNEGEDQPRCQFQVVPDQSDLSLGATTDLALQVQTRRPWFGLPQKCLFEVKAIVSDPRLDVRNDTQILKLRICPLVPGWMQIAGGLGLLWLLWWLSWLNPHNPFWGHKAAVNSVQFNGSADKVISGSDDQSMINWRVDGFFNPIINQNAGTIGKTGKAVRVVRYRPVNNNLVAAGLENGEIQLWNAIAGHRQPNASFVAQKDDRVLDLAFTKDSRYLFSSHGSGLVLQWNLDRDPASLTGNTLQPTKARKLNFAAYALAPVGDTGQNLAIGGRFNRLVLWDWVKNQSRTIAYKPGSKEDYILSLATADYRSNLLAIADNQGTLTLLNLRQCLQKGNCEVLDQWQGSETGKPILSVALSPDGCYLASAGDDGKTLLWPLTPEGKRSPEFLNGKLVESVNTKLRSVALSQVNQNVLVGTGGADSEVRLNRVKAFNPTCGEL